MIEFITIEKKNPHRDLTKAEHSAIIGYWRNGMTMEEIAMAADISSFDAERICYNYSKGIKYKSK